MPGNPVMIVYLRKGAEHPTAVEAGSRADRKMQANPQIYTCQNPDARPKKLEGPPSVDSTGTVQGEDGKGKRPEKVG